MENFSVTDSTFHSSRTASYVTLGHTYLWLLIVLYPYDSSVYLIVYRLLAMLLYNYYLLSICFYFLGYT